MIFIKKISITILSKHSLNSCYFSQKKTPNEQTQKKGKKKKKAFLLVRYLIKPTYRFPHELFTARKLLACRNSLVMLFYRSGFKNFHLWSRFHKQNSQNCTHFTISLKLHYTSRGSSSKDMLQVNQQIWEGKINVCSIYLSKPWNIKLKKKNLTKMILLLQRSTNISLTHPGVS